MNFDKLAMGYETLPEVTAIKQAYEATPGMHSVHKTQAPAQQAPPAPQA